MFSTRTFPRAILHFDADSFFASIEQALDHRLRGKPVVTGGERGAATSVSVEGKRRGLYRGMSLREMKVICPDLVIVTSDYTAYSIYAKRMYAIAREFTSAVEEYSIDECFADITGLRQKYRTSYEGISKLIHARLENDLGITFGVGLGPNKAIAKIASKWNKPAGFTAIPAREIHTYLKDLPIGSIWGMGFSTSLYLEKLGVHTALDFALKDDEWLTRNKLSKPYRDIWLELRGGFIRNLSTHENDEIGSILQSRTVRPTTDRSVLLSTLAKNVEGACAKARRHKVQASRCRFYLKTQAFTYEGRNLSLSVPVSDPREFLRLIESQFDAIYRPDTLYRATGFGLYGIVPNHATMPDLFGTTVRIESQASLINAVDSINRKYGKHTVSLAASLDALTRETSAKRERAKRGRTGIRLPITLRKKTINIPYLGVAR